MGWDYLAIGPALPNHPWSYAAIPGLLGITEDLFCSAIVADESRFYPTAVRASAQVIKDATHLRADGFANLRFAALANVPAGTPFFPAAITSRVADPPFHWQWNALMLPFQRLTAQLTLIQPVKRC